MEIQNVLKRCLKGKISYTLGTFVRFMMNGVLGLALITNLSPTTTYGAQEDIEGRLTALEKQLQMLQIKGSGKATVANDASNGVAIGNNAAVQGMNGIAVGKEARARNMSVAVGADTSTASYSTAIGVDSRVEKTGGTAIGENSRSTNIKGSALGSGSEANGALSVALGAHSQVGDSKDTPEEKRLGGKAIGGIAVGFNTQTLAPNAIALGRDSMALAESSAAIGLGSIAGEANTVSFGQNIDDLNNNREVINNYGGTGYTRTFTRRLVNVADGIKPTDAATVRQLNEINSYDIVSRDKGIKVISDRDGKLYNVTELAYYGGQYYKKSDVEGKTLNSDGKFYNTADIAGKIYVKASNDKNGTGGYYDPKFVTLHDGNGSYKMQQSGAEPVKGVIVQPATLSEFQLKPEDKLKLKVRNIDVNGQPVMAMTNLGKGEISENSTDAINGSQIYTLQNEMKNSTTHWVNVNSSGTNTNYDKANSGAKGSDSIAIGKGATANYMTGVAIGPKATSGTSSGGFSAVALGESSKALPNFAVAIGSDAHVTDPKGTASIAIGFDTKNASALATVIGQSAKADGTSRGAVVIGSGAFSEELTKQKDGTYQASIDGKTVKVDANKDAASAESISPVREEEELKKEFGNTYGTVAIGLKSSSHELFATSLGPFSTATGIGSTALGSDTTAFGKYSVAIGNYADARALNSVALGSQSKTDANYENTTALYTGQLNNDKNAGIISVGNTKVQRRILNVAGGAEDSDAVNLAQLKAVVNATGLTQDEIAKINSKDSDKPKTLVERIDGVNGKIDELGNKVAGQKTVFTADNADAKLETELGTPIEIVSGDFKGPKVTTNGSARDTVGHYKSENIAVNVVDGKVQIGLDTNLTGMEKFQTKIGKSDTIHEGNDEGYYQHTVSNNGFISNWYATEDGSTYNNISATLRASNDPIHQGLVISGLKNGMPSGAATYNLGYMDITANKADFSGEDNVKMDPQGLHFQDTDFINPTDVITLTKGTKGKKSALTFKLDENSKGTGEVNGLANGKISADSTQAINGSQLKGFADKIGFGVDTDNTVKAPELKDIRNKKPTSIIDATNKLATEVNKGFNVAAVKGTQVTKNLGDTVTIKNGDLSETQFVGKNLSTEIKDGNVLIGMKDKPEFGGVTIKRDPAKPVNELGNDEVLTKAETSALAKSSIKVINGTNTTVSEGTEGDIKTYAVNISDEAIKNAVKGDLDSKADVTALNELKDQINTSKDTDDKRNEYLGQSDNLNNVAINDKVNAIRRGEAGSIVYTDRENARIKRAKDGKLYKEEYINPETDLPWEDTDVKALETTSVIASVVNVDGSTTNKTILSNIADGVKDNDAVNVAQLNQVKENLNTATENLGNIDKKIDGVQTKVNDNSSKLDNLDKALNEAKGLLAGLGDRLEDDNDSRNLNNDNLNGDTINNKINAIRRGEAGSLVYTDGNGERVVKADNGNFYRLKDVDGATNNPLEDKVSNIVKSEDVVQTLVNTKGETTEPIKLKNVKAGNVGANSTDAVNGDQLYKYSKWKIQTEDNESTRGTVGYDPDSEGNEVLTLKTKNSINQDETSKNLTISNIGNTVEFSLNKDIKVETVNANKIVINRNNKVTEDSDVLNKKETTELIKNTVKTDMDSKMNKDLSNIDNAGEQKIKDIAKTSITTDLENYAKKDASNIVKENWTKALGTGEITETSEELVTGKTVKAALDKKVEKSDLANLASKNLDNLSDKGREVINKQAKEALKSDFETANKNIKSNADAIDKNKESIKAVDKVSSENTKAIKQNTSDIKANNQNIAKNKDDIAKLKNKSDKNEKNIDANKKAIANHEERITKNEKVLKQTYQAQAEVLANHAQAINANRNAIRSLNNRVDHLDDKLNKGMALMSAMTTVDFQDVNPGEMGIGAGIGSYGNSQGVAVGVAYSPSENFRINAKYSVSTSDIKTSAVGVGAVYKFKVR